MSTSMEVCPTTHIGLDLSQIQKDGVRPDIRIIVNDLNNPFHQFTIDTHYIVLWAASLHFRKTLQFTDYTGKNQTNDIIITIDFSENTGITEKTVIVFFSLFYVPSFSVDSLDSARYEFIEENILQLYQLSELFIFQPLKLHCEKQLFASFSLDHFKLLTEFALVPSPNRKNMMSIVDERVKLYSRYLQWYQCCVEESKYMQLPGEGNPNHTNKNSNDILVNRSNSTGNNSVFLGFSNGTGTIVRDNNSNNTNKGGGVTEEMEVEGPGFIYTEYFSCKKSDILEEWKSAIENFNLCPIPSRSIRTNGKICNINYYRKLCRQCIKAEECHRHDHYIDLGVMTRKSSTDDSYTYSFRLKKSKLLTNEYILELGLDHKIDESSSRQAKRLKLLANSYRQRRNSNEQYQHQQQQQQQEMIIDDNNSNMCKYCVDMMHTSSSSSSSSDDENIDIYNEYIYNCRSTVTLLSKQLDLPTFNFHYTDKHIGFVGQDIGGFSLHEKNDCYIGRCDKCKESETGVYIIILKIMLERLKLFRPCKCKNVNT